MSRNIRFVLAVGVALVAQDAAAATGNFFANPDFEMGRQGWHVSKTDGSTCRFAVDNEDAGTGRHSVLVTVDRAEDWGTQFGQSFAAGRKGKTYTFAVLAKAARGPVAVDLQIERNAKPYDRAAKGGPFTLTNKWQELHVTFKVAKDFPQGWFAYISCTQSGVQYRADMFRLCEGPYVPYETAAREAQAPVAVHLFDTAAPAPGPLPSGALRERRGWVEVPEDHLEHAFKGDAVFLNNRLAVVLRRSGAGAEVYALDGEGGTLRARLTPVGDASADRLAGVRVAENHPACVAVEAAFESAGRKTLRLAYALRMGQVLVETTARAGVTGLRVEAPCRFMVLPDFFADDIVLDAPALPVSEADVPADHFVLHLLPDRRAIVMTVVQDAADDVRVRLSGDGADKRFRDACLRYGKGGKAWVAVLAAPGIWHEHVVAKEQAGRIVPLDWQQPFPAQWRVDWRRADGLTDTWEMVAERSDGRFEKQGWYGGGTTLPPNRSRWTTVLGRFSYPCWTDASGRGHLQPLKSKVLRFEGPAVLYPVNRRRATPLDAFTVLDVVRDALGVGPCEYILDVEGQHSESKGWATCATRDTLNPIFAKKQQRQQRAKIEKALDEVMVFIRHIRGRIENYVAFGHDLRDYLAAQKRAHPELAEPLAELERLARVIDEKVAARRAAIKTPDHAQKMCDAFRRTMIDYQGHDAYEKCKQFTKALVDIGGNQDELAGEGRWAVKVIRQHAGLMMARDPRLAGVADEIRRRTQKVMRNPAGHEGARH